MLSSLLDWIISLAKGSTNFYSIVEATTKASSSNTLSSLATTSNNSSNSIVVKGLIVYDRVIEEGLLEEAKKQYPIARQPRGPIRRGSSRAAEP
ncbi:hypothetical protein P8C59_003278 [Phyllachora maydis]|uniref:Uncharacterized protein n=1 Tax=Phyllachora maydis TaxID=1825666 RepID=A0AAD9HZW5_9PEZI|nr:hypothetical protein P8C59_003278 [Phyllachora maydis]